MQANITDEYMSNGTRYRRCPYFVAKSRFDKGETIACYPMNVDTRDLKGYVPHFINKANGRTFAEEVAHFHTLHDCRDNKYYAALKHC